MTVSVREKIAKLRQKMAGLCCNGYYLTINDPHLSEYIPDHFQLLEFLTGFSGSAGTLIVTDKEALLWADSRYWVQAAQQLTDTGITLMKWGSESVPSPIEWLEQSQSPIDLLIHDELVSIEQYEKLATATQTLLGINNAWINDLWSDRPSLVELPIFAHTASVKTAQEKRCRLQSEIKKYETEQSLSSVNLLLTKLDDIAWLTNLRGDDIAYNPVFFAWALMTAENATLFVNAHRFPKNLQAQLQAQGWTIEPYDAIDAVIAQKVVAGETIVFDQTQVNAHFLALTNGTHRHWNHPLALWKSIKEPQEIEGLKIAMKRDGHALMAFIDEIRARLAQGERLTENDAVEILHQKRLLQENFITESFSTIAAVNANAALPHYEPIPGQGAVIEPPCVLLVDSGAHYHEGTTDTTRVWFLGNPEDFKDDLNLLKQDYTAVYRGMKALMKATFPMGTRGIDLDKIARQPILATGIDYGHGTGHGIGLTLNVHETPPTISPRETKGTMTPLQPGMVMSDEPGIYREGRWGIRIENTIVCVDKGNGMLGFESVTTCPIETTLLNGEL